jgi:tRNA1(Val) A37 N6-methylase TrmN6
LGGLLTLKQPAHGFRAGMDSVMLPAAVPAADGQAVLELGSGAGVAALCLARRVPGVHVAGLEMQDDMVALSTGNAAANGLSDRTRFLHGVVEQPPTALPRDAFDHVMMNPPYFVEGLDDPSPNAHRRASSIADADALARWAKCARTHLKARGTLTAIIPAERLPAMLIALDTGFGGVTVFPLWPRDGEPARRILIHARKGSRAPFALKQGLVLHGTDGTLTRETDAILRTGAGLPLT